MRRWVLIGCMMVWPLAAVAKDLARDLQAAPEAATGRAEKSAAIGDRQMVVAAHPLAAEAGRDILRKGGSALDAAIATQLVLGLVEPQSSGLGGGAFIVSFDAKSGEVTTFDGRETAPNSAKPDRFLVDGRPMDFPIAVRSGLSVGVPGVMRAMELAHRKHGALPWADLFAPAIALAETGFAMPERLFRLLKLEGADVFPSAARDFFFQADGAPKPPGTLLKNDAYAATLKTLAREGATAFYDGAIADAIVEAVAAAPFVRGDMTRDDLKAYRAIERPPVCFAYRARRLCGMGPPSSGALTVAQTLKLIEPNGAVQGAAAALSPAALHAIAEAEKLAYADRNFFIADPDVIAVPDGLLDDAYLAERRRLIAAERAMSGPPSHGYPPGWKQRTHGADATHERAGTSHLSIVDANGNGVAMTTTIEGAFGSRLWAAGFLLNNELTDFSMRPVDKDGLAMANAVGGGKRPRSSMAPMLVFDKDGALEVLTGSPGGSRIILYVVKVLVAMLDWNMSAQQAAALANFGSDGGALTYEANEVAPATVVALKALGHVTHAEMMTSGVHTILRRGGRLEGGADPRRDGVALGD